MKIIQHKENQNRYCNECKSRENIRTLKLKKCCIDLCIECREELYRVTYHDVMIRK